MVELSDDVIAFVSEGTRTGVVGYLAADGRPLVAPVSFVVDNGDLVFNTPKASAKGRALARDNRVAISVDNEVEPYSSVQLQGMALLSEDPIELRDTATRIGARYMGQDRAEEVGRRNSVPGMLVVRVRPTKIIPAFDPDYEPPGSVSSSG